MIPAWLMKYIHVLTTEKKLGLSHSSCTVASIKPGGGWAPVQAPQDTFILHVPYATDTLKWLVMFDSGYPEFPPDFIFDCQDFLPDLSDLDHLTNWDSRDTAAFSNVITELYREYRKYQVSLLSLYPRLQVIYNSIIRLIDEELVEVHLPAHERKVQQSDSVVFIVKIEGPFSKIPPQLLAGVKGENLVLLTLHYINPESSTKPESNICISPKLNQVFGQNIQFPTMTSSNVPRYITELKDFLTDRIGMLDNGLGKRKAYLEALQEKFEGGILEIDTEEYLTASILINFRDFHFILQVTMPAYFPKEQPKLTFCSVYHTDDIDKPFSKSSRAYPWSPRWSPEEMIKRLQAFIADVIPNFQRASVIEGTALRAKSEPPPDYA
ncbi:BRISC and BRCA1-A complex member 2-like [Watersipora subatra]|uniref:BRISC and BRCA1-A complex member 2-like n=1 Tax=Watersipora subatra TaxID=2589382 RepID=UPI00355B180B